MIEQLCKREREILTLVADGFVTKQIADKLSIKEKTVTNHRDKICKKTKVRGIANLTKLAIRSGLTTL